MHIEDFHSNMRNLFNVQKDAGKFLCEASLRIGLIRLDIIALDDLLHERHGNYEDEGLSMSDFVRKNYGEKAHNFCIEWGMIHEKTSTEAQD